MGLSRRAYAKEWGVDHKTICHAIRTGVIIPLPDSTIDREQADATWGVLHLARVLPPPTDPVWEAEMAAELAKLRKSLG
jgi:hypothetical protein